ncbi:diguanylate cyclase, partial [Kineococcus glutinatus]|uniref:histidine kinase N-terminal 7TM domain-containing diguanylate cyclase n=1 Tax=Kineococcus glutinatus TaxID=1070872 RepID=UPI0031EF5078
MLLRSRRPVRPGAEGVRVASGIAVVFLLAALLCGATAAATWRRRRLVAATDPLVSTMATIAAWCTAAAVLRLPVGVGVGHAAWVVSLAAVGVVPVAAWFMCRRVTDPRWRPRRGLAARMLALPAAAVVALLTNPWHHLVFRDDFGAGGTPSPAHEMGPLFWVYSAYSYGVSAAALAVLCAALRGAPWYLRRQLVSLVLAVLPPLGAGLVSLLWSRQLGGHDHTPLGFAVSALLYAHALFRQGLASVVPVARREVLEGLADAVVVCDPTGRVVDANAAAVAGLRRLRPQLGGDLVGRAIADLFPGRAEKLLTGGAPWTAELAPGWYVHVDSSPITDGRGRELGRAVVVRDVTELERQRRAMEAANARLAEQLRINEELRARLAEDALRDPLTGARNRRWLDGALPAALAAAAGAGQPLSVLVVDVDHFKVVNDTHGHPVGDLVLQAVVRELLATTRAADGVARFGGEEFVVVLPGAGPAEAVRCAERVRRRCEGLQVPVGGPAPQDVRVTVSVGVGSTPGGGTAGTTA